MVGLAHHDKAAESIKKLGGTPHQGSLDDIESVRSGAASADAVVHLAFNHDFTKHAEACATDLAVTQAMLEALGKDKPYVGTSAPIWDLGGKPFDEADTYDASQARTPRHKTELYLKQQGSEGGYKTSFVRLPPTVHGPNDPNFIPAIIGGSKKEGKVGYVGEGDNRWAAVHIKDAARLYVATLEGLAKGTIPGGQTIQASEDGGSQTKDIAKIIAEKAKIDLVSITPEQSMQTYSPFIGGMWAANIVMKSDITRKLTGWQPKENTLVQDLEAGIYTF